MAQSLVVMAFRKRMKHFGYTNISIKYDTSLLGWSGAPYRWSVFALEPLAGTPIKVVLSETEMYYKFRRS